MSTDLPRSGGAIGSGLFIGSASAFTSGGPASVFLGFFIIGKLGRLKITVQ